jgi:hypothetical protein
MQVTRFIRHLFTPPAITRRRFGPAVAAGISAAIRAAEERGSGEVRFAVETGLGILDLWSGLTPRERAGQVFSQLQVWDTELRNGVLIYVLVADRVVEIVADRGAAARIDSADWQRASRLMEEHFRAGRFHEGAIAGVAAVGELLARHFPAGAANRDELPNQPTLL